MGLISVRMGRFIKGSLLTMRSLEQEWRFMRMGICTWGSFRMEKSMGMAISFGLIYRVRTPKQTNSYSTMTDSGGAAYPTALESTNESTVLLYLIHIGDLYTGNFKNGLKHG